MENRAGNQSTHEAFKKEGVERKRLRRKNRLNKILTEKRMNAHHKDQAHQKGFIDLEEEEKKEGEEEKGHMDLNKHYKKSKRKSRKKCWNCKSAYHFRDHCPYIRCFHCHRLGHVKANCFMYRIQKLLKALEKQEKRKQKRRNQKAQKQKEREEEIETIRKRARQSEFIKEQGKWRLKWQEMQIGTYIEPGTPILMEEVQKKTFKWQHIEVRIKHPTQIKKLHLKEGFPNQCACGTMLMKSSFIKHLYDKHKGVAPPDSLINMPPWIHCILFDTDEIELLYCRTDQD